MLALLGTVIALSVAGSLHCAGMCGAFVACAVGLGEPAGRGSAWPLHAAYNGGRLVTYSLLGAVAGAMGQAMDLGAASMGFQRAAMVLAGATMVVAGLAMLLKTRGVALPRVRLPRVLEAGFRRGTAAAMALTPVRRALVLGLLTTLLPCGWLYAFALMAAGTASPLWGAAAMAAFWVGTLPIMLAVGGGVRALAGPLRRHVPAVMALAIVAAGVVALSGRVGVDLSSVREAARARARPVASPASEAGATLRAATQAPPPCCAGE